MPNRNSANLGPKWWLVAALVVVLALVVALVMVTRSSEGFATLPPPEIIERGNVTTFPSSFGCSRWFAGVTRVGPTQVVSSMYPDGSGGMSNVRTIELMTRMADGNVYANIRYEASDVRDARPFGIWNARVGDVFTLPLKKAGAGYMACRDDRDPPKFTQTNCAQEPARSSRFCYWYPGAKFYVSPPRK